MNTFLTLTRKPLQTTPEYFGKNFVFGAVPTILLGLIATLLFKGRSPSPFLAGSSSIGIFWQFLFTVIVIPFFESFILIYPTALASSFFEKQRFSAFFGSLPLIILHGLIQWQKAIVVSPFFYVQAFSYLELRKECASFWGKFLFIFLLHALFNLFLLIALYI